MRRISPAMLEVMALLAKAYPALVPLQAPARTLAALERNQLIENTGSIYLEGVWLQGWQLTAKSKELYALATMEI